MPKGSGPHPHEETGTGLGSGKLRDGVVECGDQRLVLGLQMFLDLDGFAQYGLGVFVGVLGTHVRGCRRDVLSDDDDREQDQLQKGLSDPGDDAFTAGSQRRRQPG